MRRILLVDGIREERETGKEILAYAGYEVLPAASGNDAIGKYRGEQADLIIAYVVGDGDDGLQVISQLHHEFPGVKIFAISGLRPKRHVEFSSVARALGASRVLVKPFRWDHMLSAIEDIIGE